MIIICISNFAPVVFASNSQSFQLDEGWNLVTVSVIPSNSDVAQVIPCANIVKNYECYFCTNQPAFLNSISDVIPGHGYLVHVNEICNFDIDGELINPSNVVLKEGWNIVGYPFLHEQDIESALSSIINNIEVVKDFDGFWTPAMGTNSISNLIPGRAYYIKVNQECTLIWSSLYSLDVNVNPNETGSVVGMGNYTNGTEVIVSAIANQAYIFENWTGDTDFISNVNSPIATVIMPSSNIYLTANFVPASGGEDFIDEVNGVDFEMIFVQGGTYMRGCDDCAENDRQYEAPVHSVTLSDYHIGKYEVTNAQWIAVMGGSLPWGASGDSPKVGVSWFEANEYICQLNSITGKTYRLLTDAEWEFAARGGNLGVANNYRYSGSNNSDDVAWYSTNSNNQAQVVGTKAPNELGVYDMSGNSWEWVYDWLMPYTDEPKTDPVQITGAGNKTRRGGSYDEPEAFARVSRRAIRSRDGAAGMGFRIAHSSLLPTGMQTPCEAANPTAVSCEGHVNRDCRVLTPDGYIWSAEIGTGFYANLIITETGAAFTMSANGFAFTQISGEWYSLNNRSLNLISNTGATTTYAYYVFSDTEMSMIGTDGMPLRFYKKPISEAGGVVPNVPNITNPSTIEQLIANVEPERYVSEEELANPNKNIRDSRLIQENGKTWFMDGSCFGGNHKYRFHLSANGDAEFVVMDYDNTLRENILAKGTWFTVGNIALHIELDGQYYNYLYMVGNRVDASGTCSPAGPIYSHLSFQSYERGDMRVFSTYNYDSNVTRPRGPSGENPVYPPGEYQTSSGGN